MTADPINYLAETEAADDPVGAALVFTGAAVAGFCAAVGASHVLKVMERRKEKDRELGFAR